MQAGVARSFAVPSGPCPGIPAALGYGLIFTAIGPDATSVQLRAWATGSPLPTTPTLTLNKGTGPNPNDTPPRAAAIEASPTGSVDVLVDVGTHLVIELNAYYTPGLLLNLTAGTGLIGGGTGNVTLGINTAGATNGQVLTYNGGGTTGWTTPGTITGVTAGTGLTGGGSSGSVTLNVNFAGSGTANTAARSDHSHFLRTVVVSPAATPTASGNALISALAAITASDVNPYLLKIEPGIYDLGTQTLAMQPYVDIEGSGEIVTTITSATNNFSLGTVNAASNSALRQLTVTGTAGANYAHALSLNGVTNFRADHVSVRPPAAAKHTESRPTPLHPQRKARAG